MCSPGNKRTKFGSKSSPLEQEGFSNFIRTILPPPPDVRKVEYKNRLSPVSKPAWMDADVPEPVPEFGVGGPLQSRLGGVRESGQQKIQVKQKQMKQPDITNLNTTLIGDYTATVYPQYNVKWLVQATGNATFKSTIEAVKSGNIVVDRKYIFIQLGGNQLRTADKTVSFTVSWSSRWQLGKNHQSVEFISSVFCREWLIINK